MVDMNHKMSREVAEAYQQLETPDPDMVLRFTKPTHANVLVDIAKRLQRLQTKRSKLKRELKRVNADIRASKRELKAMAREIGRGKQ